MRQVIAATRDADVQYRLVETFATLSLLVVIGIGVLESVGHHKPPGWTCLREAFDLRHFVAWHSVLCRDAMEAYLLSARDELSAQKAWFVLAQVTLWADNLFVSLYTAFFITAAVWSYQRRAGHRPMSLWKPRLWMWLSVVVALATAFCDHSENFWSLAQIDEVHLRDSQTEAVKIAPGEIAAVAGLSLWKFRLWLVCLIMSLRWIALALRQEMSEAKDAQQFQELASDAHRKRFLFKNDVQKSDDFWTVFDAKRWHEAAPIAIKASAARPVGMVHGCIFATFLASHGRGRRSYFLASSAVRYVEGRFGEGQPASTKVEVEAFLHHLARLGYLSPAGKRFEILRGEP